MRLRTRRQGTIILAGYSRTREAELTREVLVLAAMITIIRQFNLMYDEGVS